MPGSKKHARGLLMSSNDFAIRVQGLSKYYQIYDAPTDRLKQMLVPRLQRMMGKQPKQYFS
jgi:lipopolysaccharide transport system ATP-binding protein